MAAYTSTQDGAWDVTSDNPASPWYDGGVQTGWASAPGDGDTASVGHDVYIQGNVTVGTDAGATTAAITITSGGKVRWTSSITGSWTLTLKGIIDIEDGGEFECDISGTDSYTAIIEFAGSFEFQNIIEGTLNLQGYPAYHMGATTMQRAQLIADVTAGIGQTFQVDKDVDWSVGDSLWVSSGGDPTESWTGNEQITISTKINASTYTATFVNNHFGDGVHGDLVIQAERNLIVKGQGTTQGFSFHTNSQITGIVDINWVRFEYLSSGNTQVTSGFSFTKPAQGRFPKDSIKMKNSVFDTPGDAAGRIIYFYGTVWEEDPTYTNISEIHAWQFDQVFGAYDPGAVDAGGIINLGHISSLETHGYGVQCAQTGGDYIINIHGLWYTTYLYTATTAAFRVNLGSISDFEIHYSNNGIVWLESPGDYVATESPVISNGKISHTYLDGIQIGSTSDMDDKVGEALIENVEIYRIRRNGTLVVEYGGNLTMNNCTLDDCNRLHDAAAGAFRMDNSDHTQGIFRFENCEFGTSYVNYNWNFTKSINNVARGPNRIIFEKCKFKEPANFGVTYAWSIDELLWALGQNYDNWTTRGGNNALRTYELIECELQNASGVDQWSTVYPNTDRVGLIGAGGEIHKTNPTTEATGYKDGTFQRKFMPFMGTTRVHITKISPIKIPVNSGDTITVKLFFKKNVSQNVGERPMLHLWGCGLRENIEMTDVISTWQELTASGTVTVTGSVCCWVSCRGVPDIHDPGSPPVKALVDDITWAYPIEPGGTGTGIGPPDNLILYCDGLDITVS